MRRFKRLGLQILILVIFPGLFLINLGGVVYYFSESLFRAFLVPAFLVSVLGFGVIWPLWRLGGFIILNDMTAASVTFLNQHRRIIMSASLRRGDWNLLGGLRIIGIPGLHRLREFTTTRVVEVTSSGEVRLEPTPEKKILSLQDQSVDLVFKDSMSKNQIQMDVRFRMFYRVNFENIVRLDGTIITADESVRRIIYAAEDWTTILVQRMRPIVRQVIAKHDWPTMNQKRNKLIHEITEELQRDTRPSMGPGGVPDPRSTMKFILEEYGIHIQAVEPGIILPIETRVKQAGEIAYTAKQDVLRLKELAAAYKNEDVRRGKEYEITADAAKNVRNVIIGGPIQGLLNRILPGGP